MIVRVIYRDQTAGVVEKNLLDDLIKRGRIAAYNCTDTWVSIEWKGCCVYACANERRDDSKLQVLRMLVH